MPSTTRLQASPGDLSSRSAQDPPTSHAKLSSFSARGVRRISSAPRCPPLPCTVEHGRDVLGDSTQCSSREFIVTNGVGGYCSATLGCTISRSYHGMLVAALKPPLDRTLLLSALDERATYLGRVFPLAPHGFVESDSTAASLRMKRSTSSDSSSVVTAEHSILRAEETPLARDASPTCASFLESFRLEGTVPIFTYTLGDAVLEKQVWMKRAENAVFIRYKLLRASRPVALSIDALVNHRSHHSRTIASCPGFSHSTSSPQPGTIVTDFRPTPMSAGVPQAGQATRLILKASRGLAVLANSWIHGAVLERERERGLPSSDDHVHAATFCIDMAPGAVATIVAAACDGKAKAVESFPEFVAQLDGDAELEMQHKWEWELINRFRSAREQLLQRRVELEEKGLRRLSLKSQALQVQPSPFSHVQKSAARAMRGSFEPAILQLVLAADQFVIERGAGKSIIAGYHWFADWSRDTMIALPGLTISTGRLDVARAILLTFAKYVSCGMLPNRFPDDGGEPGDDEYNTSDGTLWYFESIRSYYAASGDSELLRTLFPTLEDIVQHHCAGTRFGIKMDSSDGLLRAGVEGVALSWMDAKAGDHVFTPRIGKPVELGALWFNALSIMATFAGDLGHDDKSDMYSSMAYETEKGFRRRFWNKRKEYCYDVVDGPDGSKDEVLRPNQLIAASLQWSPLTSEQRLKIVEVCAQYLVTSHSIRTLPQYEEGYYGVYDGNIFSRDAAYHQGTGWAWLMGPFVIAHYRVYKDRNAARAFLLPLLSTLQSGGQGTISEIFDGDAPHRPRGCIAQAWSVAEFLRAWLETEPSCTRQSA